MSLREGFDTAMRLAGPANDAVFVRPSAHRTWLMCQEAVALTRHPDYDNKSSMQAQRGTGVHLLNELKITGNEAVTMGEAHDLWLAEMERRDESPVPYVPADRLKAVAAEIWDAHLKWVKQFWYPVGQYLEIISTERRMLMPLGVLPNGREVWMRGTADLITQAKVWDWKTSTTGWQTKKLDEQTQHLYYAALVEYELEMQVDEASYVIFNFKTGQWEWSEFTLSVNRARIDRALFEMFKMGAVLDAGGAMASPAKRGAAWGQDGRGWWCSAKWCGAWDICDAKFILDDGKATGKRDNTITWK